MTPEEKAKELVERFEMLIGESDFHIPEFISGIDMESNEYGRLLDDEQIEHSKQCALICVDEILDSHMDEYSSDGTLFYWQNVKQEIERL